MWEIKVDGDVTHMTPVFDKNRKTRRYADAVVVASRVGMTNAGLAVIGANGTFRSDPCTMAGRYVRGHVAAELIFESLLER
jgi:hypothetical protein